MPSPPVGAWVAQLAQVVALIIAFSTLLDRALLPMQQMLAQTQAQIMQINAKLDEVPRLSGSVERLGKTWTPCCGRS